jgi:signal peptidase II
MRRRFVFLIALLVTIADQLTKQWALRHLPANGSVPLIPGFLEFTLTSNTGAAFSMLQSSTLILAGVALLVVAVIAAFVVRNAAQITLPLGIALALPMGGALGNFIDRVARHSVVDFIDAYVGTHHWPIFNVADSAICVGVALLAITLFKKPTEAVDHAVTAHSTTQKTHDAGEMSDHAEPSTPIGK